MAEKKSEDDPGVIRSRVRIVVRQQILHDTDNKDVDYDRNIFDEPLDGYGYGVASKTFFKHVDNTLGIDYGYYPNLDAKFSAKNRKKALSDIISAIADRC